MLAVGCVVGWFLSFLASLLFSTIPTRGNYISCRPSAGLILPTVTAAFVLCVIGSLYPAWRAIRLPPAVALRHV